jgi:excisionase family DNA binding protein
MALTRLYTVPEAAEALKVTEAAIRRWIWQRRLTVVKIGSAVRIEEAELAQARASARAIWGGLRARPGHAG